MSTLKKTENNLGQDEKVRSLWKQSVIQFKHNRLAVVGLVIIVLFIVTILTTLAVDQITNYSFYNEYIIKQDLSLRLAKPAWPIPLDATSLAGSSSAHSVGNQAFICHRRGGHCTVRDHGSPLRHDSRVLRGQDRQRIMRVMDVLLAVPYMLLAMAIVAALGPAPLPASGSGRVRYCKIRQNRQGSSAYGKGQ